MEDIYQNSQYILQDNIQISSEDSKLLDNSSKNIIKDFLVEFKKIAFQLLEEALVEQEMLVRRIGVRISEFSDMEGQSDITSYF